MDTIPTSTKLSRHRQLRRIALQGLIVLPLLLTVLFVGLRLSLSHVDRFRPEITALVSDLIGHRVSIHQLEVQWEGLKTLALTMQQVTLLNEAGTEPIFEFKHARVTIDILSSAIAGEVSPGNLVVTGARIALIRESDGTFAAQGLDDHQDALLSQSSPNVQRDTFAIWVLAQEELRLESATLIWHDRRRGGAPTTLVDVNIHTFHDGKNRHRVNGSATLPPELGALLSFELDIVGDPLSKDWSGSVSLHADKVHLSALSNVHPSFEIGTASGEVSVNLDTEWTLSRLTTASGRYQIKNAEIDWATGSSNIHAATGQFRLERGDEDWTFDLEQELFNSRNGDWLPTQAHFELVKGQDSNSPTRFIARVSYARLEDLLPLIINLGPQRLRPLLIQHRLQGIVENVELDATLAANEVTELTIAAQLHDLSTPARGTVPGLSGLSGQLQTDLSQGRFLLKSNKLTVTMPDVFPQPLNLSESHGEITWKRRGTGWWFDIPGVSLTNSDLAGTISGKVHWPYGNSLPILDIATTVEFADLSQLSHIFPMKLLRPRFATWMQQAVRAGQLKDVQFLYRGYAGDFPFDSGEDSLLLQGRVENLDLEYSSRWPAVSALAAEFSVKGVNFGLTATSGNVYGGNINSGTAYIDDLSSPNPFLTINTQLSGPAQNGLQFLREGTLSERFGGFAEAIQAGGDIEVDLNVTVPLAGGKKSADGTISLLGNNLELNNVKIALADVTGKLTFTPNSMSASSVEAMYLQIPITIDLRRANDEANSSQLAIRGTANKAYLLRQLHALALFADPADPPRILSHIEGTTQWQATVDLPDRWGEGTAPARVRVVSNLDGMALSLPAPFEKTAEESKRLTIEAHFFRSEKRNVKIQYGADIGSQFELKLDEENYHLSRGVVVFGDTSPDLPTKEGLYVGGQLEQLSIDHWSEIMTEPDQQASTGERTDYPILRVLEEVEIRTNALELLGNLFDGAHITVSRNEKDRWRVEVKGNSVDGEVLFPMPDEQGEPIIIALNQLRLGKIEQDLTIQNRYDPRGFPPLKFSAKNIMYDDINIGTIKFSTSPHPQGLSIDSLFLLSDSFEATSVGTWTLRDGQHHSQFLTELHTDELDQLLRALGQEESTAQGGATDVVLTLDWPGSPSQFSLKRVVGVVQIRSSRGRLLDINPGATGRLVGFLMMTALPRRLKLDFSDIFSTGITYEVIDGSFALENGHAYTNNLMVDSLTATIEIAGRTGLIDEDYDKVVTITPKLASSLPLAPLWLLEKLLQREIFDKTFSYQYTITGSWEDPQIERIAIETETKLDDAQAGQ